MTEKTTASPGAALAASGVENGERLTVVTMNFNGTAGVTPRPDGTKEVSYVPNINARMKTPSPATIDGVAHTVVSWTTSRVLPGAIVCIMRQNDA